MGLIKGGFQRLFQTFLYVLTFLCSAIILGVYSYFLSVLADRNQHISDWKKAVEGISGAAVLYLIFAVCLTCCLGGITGLAIVAVVLDLLFAAGMVAIAILTRSGANSCKGTVITPIGNGSVHLHSGLGHLGLACKLNTAAFAVSIIAALLFLCTAGMQIALIRHHKKEKRFGPSPANNYTGGYGKGGFFGRNKKTTATKDAEAGALPVHDNRVSHETGYTGTTTGGPQYDSYKEGDHAATQGTHTGYYTAPTGTAVNPYGYSNTATNY